MTARMLMSVGLLALACPLCMMMGGCLKRTIAVTTEPPGALIWINDVEVGRTPLETDFTFYGDYDVRIRREGYEPILTHMKAKPPLHEQPVVDLAADALPVQFHNVLCWHWVLTPVAEVSQGKEQAEQDLIARANELRERMGTTPK